jgi:carboxypeptidase T
MSVIAKVTSTSPRASLSQLLSVPLGLDVWEVKADYLVLQATEAQAERLEHMGYGVEQLHETKSYLSTFATEEAMAGFHTVETLGADLLRLADDHSEIAQLRVIGRSVENRPIWALRLGERRGNTLKTLFLGCHHAAEWISVEVPYLLAEYLVTNASTNPVQHWLQKGEIWVIPMVNPDGHEYTRSQQRLWRKNRRRNPGGSFGVDPNRNYGYMWGTLDNNDNSHDPQHSRYVGPRAFSEPEVRAVRDLVARELFAGVLTYHSYGQLILFPWGYTTNPIVDPDYREIEGLAKDMQQLIFEVHGETYTVKQSSDFKLTAGDTTDWTYGTYGIPSFTIELRPDGQDLGGFILPARHIQPTWEENRPAALQFIHHFFDKPATV